MIGGSSGDEVSIKASSLCSSVVALVLPSMSIFVEESSSSCGSVLGLFSTGSVVMVVEASLSAGFGIGVISISIAFESLSSAKGTALHVVSLVAVTAEFSSSE